MRRKFIAAAASGVLALTMTAALPTIHAAAVSIWNDITRERRASRRSSTRTMPTAIRTPTSFTATTPRRCSTTMRRLAKPKGG